MSQLQWLPVFETGTREIDYQHRRLVDYINRLDALPSDASTESISDALDNVVDYTLYHFAFEECLLEEAGDRHLQAHQRMHAGFMAQLRSLQDRFATGALGSEELRDLLSRWLSDHIRGIDKVTLKPRRP